MVKSGNFSLDRENPGKKIHNSQERGKILGSEDNTMERNTYKYTKTPILTSSQVNQKRTTPKMRKTPKMKKIPKMKKTQKMKNKNKVNPKIEDS